MALTKEKKNEIVAELTDLLGKSKMTVVVKYQGTTVAAIQELRRRAEENGTVVKVVKNRLVRKAFEATDSHKKSDTGSLEGMLLYAFNTDDEVAPAQVIHGLAKTETQLEFVGAYDATGKLLSGEEVKSLATLPGKNDLLAQVVATLLSPANDVVGGLSGGLPGILSGLEAKAAA